MAKEESKNKAPAKDGSKKPAETARVAFAIGAHYVEREDWDMARKRLSGATKMIPCRVQAARNSPFSMTFAWVQVRPERYHSTGSFAPAV